MDAAVAQLASLNTRIDALRGKVDALRRAVGRRSASITAASDALARARSALGWSLAQLNTGADRGAPGVTSLLPIIDRARSDLTRAEDRAARIRAAASGDRTLGRLFQASGSLEALVARRTEVQRRIDGLLVASRVTDSGATPPPGATRLPYGAWAGALLRSTGLQDCRENRAVLVAWQVAESTDATWNPLATTKDAPGATRFNAAGVKDYPTMEVGLRATAETLWGGYYRYGYGWIVYDLAVCAPAATTAAAIRDSAWCHGCAGGTYVTGVLSRVEANYDAFAQM